MNGLSIHPLSAESQKEQVTNGTETEIEFESNEMNKHLHFV